MERLELLMNVMEQMTDKKISEAEMNDIFITCADTETLREVKSVLDEEY